MEPFRKKRQVNKVILEGLRHSPEPIAFFCECERSMRLYGWRALSDVHWDEPLLDADRPRSLDLVSA
jgi:hypothetical protein